MKYVFTVVFLLAIVLSKGQIITSAPTKETKGWFVANSDSAFGKLDSFLKGNNKELTFSRSDVWFYNDKGEDYSVKVYLDSINNGFKIQYRGNFLNFDSKIASVFKEIGYYQDSTIISKNPYTQSGFIKKAGKNLMSTGIIGFVTPTAAILHIIVGGKDVGFISAGISITGGITSLITFFSSANNLIKAGKTRFR